MIKKTIKYTDYNGVEREEDYYFNLNKAEVIRLEVSEVGGYGEMIERIAKTQDQQKIIEIFEQFIKASYGVKSPDGKKFVKKPEDLEDFMCSEAYVELYMELATNADKAAEFIQGIMPKDVNIPEENKKAYQEQMAKLKAIGTDAGN